jgi:CRP-like cAMP-binding protein
MDTAATAFHAHCQQDRGADTLYLPGWGADDVRALFALGESVVLQPGEALMRLGESERALYFVVSGALEVASGAQLSQTMGRLVREAPGAVIGEVALFDGRPRTASVWATQRTELIKLPLAGLQAFAAAQPRLGTELLFALGRVLALRYRRGEERGRQDAALAG